MPEVFYYKDRFIAQDETPVPVEERGHQFGDGVYEVVRVYGGRPFLLDWHLDRFERSAKMIGIANPLSREQWVSLIGEAIRRSELAEAQVYWQVTRGIAPRLHTFPATEAVPSLTVRPASPKAASNSASLLALPDDRWANVYVKSLNLLPNVIAKELAKQNGAAEALYVRNGKMLEGAGSNLFFVRKGVLYTAPANRYILGGITRKFVLELASKEGIPVREEALPMEELPTVDEVFVTSTTQEILPIREVFTSEQLLLALHSLPDAAPETLVPEIRDLKVLWQAQSDSPTTNRLMDAYAQCVERFRTREVMEPLS
jgi:D-alanine transaminase